MEVTDHDFTVDEVFGAAQRDESDFDHKMVGKMEGRTSCPIPPGRKPQSFFLKDIGGRRDI
jgi:hypothetical protein